MRTFLAFVALVAACTLSLTASAQPRWQFPDSSTGRALTAFLTALDSGAEADLQAFAEAHLDEAFLRDGPRPFVSMMQDLHAQLHPFDVVQVMKTGPQSAAMVIQALDSEARVRVAFDLQPQPPHRFNDLDIQPDTKAPPAFSSFDDLGRSLRTQAQADAFAGVVLAARGGEVVFHEAYGLASKRYDIPNRPDTKLNIGSINKMFTGVAVLQLAQQGRVDLDAPLRTYLPQMPAEAGERVTVRHLLQHRAGYGSYFEHPTYQARWPELRTVADYLAFLKDEPLDFEPGTAQQYSNTGYVILGAVLEAVTGRDYYDYVREHIYAPAGMTDTDAYEVDVPVPNLAMGYLEGPDGRFDRENTFAHSAKGTPAGGGYSTAPDLLRFIQALRSHQLLNVAHTNLFFNRFEAGTEAEAPRGAAAFAGGAPGINAVLSIDFGRAETVVVLTNLGEGQGEALERPLRQLLQDAGGRRVVVRRGGDQQAPGGPDGLPQVPSQLPIDPPRGINIDGVAALPMTFDRGLPVVEATVNGAGPYRFVIDLGANVFAVSPAVAAALPVLGRDPMGNDIVPVRRLGLGSVTLGGLAAAVVPWFDGRGHDGVLGTNVFEELLLTLDYPAGVVRLDTGRLPEPDGVTVLPYTMHNGSPAVEVALGGRTVPAVLDTGAQRWLVMDPAATQGLSWSEGPVDDGQVMGPGMDAPRTAQAARLDGTVLLGGYTIRQPVVALHAMDRAEVLLGSGLLRHFALTIDQQTGRLRLARMGSTVLDASATPLRGQ